MSQPAHAPACFPFDRALLAGESPGFLSLDADDDAEGPEPGPPAPIELVPLGQKLLVELVDVTMEESSIFTAATVESATEYGRVLDMGPAALMEQMVVPDRYRVEVGTVVQFGKFSGYALEGETTMLIRTADVNGIVRGGIVTTRATRKERADAGVRQIITTGPISPADERRLRQADEKRERKATRNRRGGAS